MGEADIVRRGFAKKTGTDKFIPKIKEGFIKTMKEKYGVEKEEADRLIENFIKVIIDASSYLFSHNHAVPYSFLGYVVGYLRCYYKLETVTTALNIYAEDDAKCLEIIAYAKRNGIELKPIKFGKSTADYTMDKKENCVYKGIASVKHCNRQIADELLELSKNKYDSFTELLKDIKDKTSINSRQLTILISLNFFSDFGKNRYLLDVVDIYDKFANSKIIAKKKMEELGVSDYLMQKYAGKETKSQWRQLDNQGLINELCNRLENKSLDIVSQVRAEMDYLGYVNYVNSNMADDYYIVTGFVTYKNPCTPNLVLRRICDGEEIGCRIKQSKVFKETPFGMYSILKIEGFTYDFKNKKINGEWQKSDEREIVLENYECMKG